MPLTEVAPIRVNALNVGDQVAFVAVADGHAYVYPKPTTTGATYPTVRAIYPAAVPSGTDSSGNPITSSSVLWTVQLNGTSQFSQPIDFTINATTDWVVKGSGSV